MDVALHRLNKLSDSGFIREALGERHHWGGEIGRFHRVPSFREGDGSQSCSQPISRTSDRGGIGSLSTIESTTARRSW